MTTKRWRLAELIQASADFLKKNQIENPRLNAELLLGRSLGLERINLYLNYDRPISQEELSHYRSLIRRRITHEPLQYILGQTEFMSLTFEVQPGVLIPRADTETLVEWGIETLKNGTEKWVLDIGTGSGNIAVSLAHYLPNIRVVGVDFSRKALQVARKNVARHHLEDRILLIHSDAVADCFSYSFSDLFDCIVSNPPYIGQEEWAGLQPEVAKYEPEQALADCKNNGFFYRKIAKFSHDLLKQDGFVLVEIGANQGQKIKGIFEQDQMKFSDARKDLAGIERVLCFHI